MQASLRRSLRYAFSLALAVAILAVLLGRQDWGEFARRIRSVRWPLLLATAALAAAYWSVRVARWRWMTSLEGMRIGWPKAWTSMLAGLGVGLITPLRGGEVVRPLFVPRGARVRLAGWVVIERMFDLSAVLSLCVLGLIYMVFSGVAWTWGAPVPAWMLLLCPLLLAAALGVPLVVRYRPAAVWKVLARVLPGKARELAEIRLTGRQFAAFFAISLGAEAVNVLSVLACLRAYGSISLLTACALSPVVMLHNLLPATPGGFGIRESVAVGVFGLLGFPKEMILAAYLTNPIIMLVIPGALGVAGAWMSGVMAQLEGAGRPPPARLDDADAAE